jgi:hypothetical protein
MRVTGDRKLPAQLVGSESSTLLDQDRTAVFSSSRCVSRLDAAFLVAQLKNPGDLP